MAQAIWRGNRSELAGTNGLPVDLRPQGLIAVDLSALATGERYVFYDADPVSADGQRIPVTLRANVAGNLRVKTFGPCADAGVVLALLAGLELVPPIGEVWKADATATGIFAEHNESAQIHLSVVPAAPANLAVTPGDTENDLAWDANDPAPDGYNVYRGLSASGPWTKINSVLVATNAYNDPDLTNGVEYFYYVTAVSEAGIESDASAVDSGTPVAP